MKKHLLLSALLLTAAGMWADAVTPEQAAQIAARFLTNKAGYQQAPARLNEAQNTLQTEVVFDAIDADGNPYLYAVNNPQGGFVLVSGDDRFASVLGYSTDDRLEEEDMPENVRAWLQGYIREMAYLDSVGYQPAPRRAKTSRIAIPMLIPTTWSQNTPYNDSCPKDTYNGGMISVTGCVATAMAQLVNYHIQYNNAPTKTLAQIDGYTTRSNKLTVNPIPAGTPLPNKDLLLYSYTGSSVTDAQKAAVANLMFYCGASVNMDFSAGGSAASSSDVPNALITYFGFDSTTRLARRSDYTYSGWIELIYNELWADRPVLYGGSSSGGGHAFLVDGCDGNDLFHINWGWEGRSNDYYALSVLNPDASDETGASSSSDGYTSNQQAVIGVQINTGQTYTEPVCMTPKNYRVDGQKAVFAIWNLTGDTHTFNYGIGFLEVGGTITPIDYTKAIHGYQHGKSSAQFTVPTNTTYANTTRKVVVISREDGTSTWYTGTNPDIYYYTAEYDANGVPQLTVHPIFNIQINDLFVPSSRYLYETQSVKLSITNKGDEFYGTFFLFASTSDDKGTSAARIGVTALKSTSQTISFEWTPGAAGTYNLWVATDDAGTNVIASSSVTIREDASLQDKTLAIIKVSYTGQDRTTFYVDEQSGQRTIDVFADHLAGKVTVKNLTSSVISNYELRLYIEPYNETTGEFEQDKGNGYYYTRSFNVGGTAGISIDRTLTQNKLYRLHLALRNTNPLLTFDTRYTILLRSADSHRVTFYANGHGDTPNAQSVLPDGFAKKPADPAVSGFTFGGWFTNPECTGTPYDFATPVTAPVNLYAKWTASSATAIESVTERTAPGAEKIIRDNQFFILRDGERYDVTGKKR